MNVLLSRAKSKLVIVGSLRFLKRQCGESIPRERAKPLSFLNTVTDVIDGKL